MKMNGGALRLLLDEMEEVSRSGEGLSLMTIVWVKPDGSHATIHKREATPEHVSAGCLEVILRRGIEWDSGQCPEADSNGVRCELEAGHPGTVHRHDPTVDAEFKPCGCRSGLAYRDCCGKE